jgi:DNA polymerase elongation subunit (family B)
MALIEADTDGVYFAVPASWTQEQERELVAQIGAELPAGIHLEYEGRYRAMFSHEVKNYALLTYGSTLIVRGVAMRSSRSEPFGERFLRRALLCLLTGDIPGVQRAFLEIVEAIRRYDLPASDMASRVRLSKSPEAYLASRAGHPEPQYEALLAAGRRRWYPGERVRFYRTRYKSYVWLPDEAQESTFRGEWEDEAPPPEGDGSLPPQHGARVVTDGDVANRRDYDVDHYLNVLVTSYAARLRKAFAPHDFEQLFRLDAQAGLFDQPVEFIEPRWIRA